MNTQEKYLAWKRDRQAIEVRAGFTDRVMQQVRAETRAVPPAGPGRQFLAWMGTHLLAQAAVILLTTALALLQGAILIRIGIG